VDAENRKSTNPTADQLVIMLGWEWEAFVRDARHASTFVLKEAANILQPRTGVEWKDDLGDAAILWIQEEIQHRNRGVWVDVDHEISRLRNPDLTELLRYNREGFGS
jgi:hypothetical protein